MSSTATKESTTSLEVNTSSTSQLEMVEDVLCIKGDIHFDNVVKIAKSGLALMSELTSIKVDFKNLLHCDSSALALCSAWVRDLRKQKREVEFINLPSFLKDLIKVHGLDTVLPIGVHKKWEN